jgi:hypothetical protein
VQKKRLASSSDRWERALNVKQLTAKDMGAEKANCCKGNPNSLDEQPFSQDLARGNPRRTL